MGESNDTLLRAMEEALLDAQSPYADGQCKVAHAIAGGLCCTRGHHDSGLHAHKSHHGWLFWRMDANV